MKRLTIYWLFLAVSFLSTSGCSAYWSDMTGTVVDAETGKPIEGAVVLVEWTKTKGIGLTNTESYKVQEVVTPQDGTFSLSGVADPFVNVPRLTIYKRDYVAWNSELIFPTREKRQDFVWGKQIVIRMKPFTRDYSRHDHVAFLYSVTHWGKAINKAYRWEELEKERPK